MNDSYWNLTIAINNDQIADEGKGVFRNLPNIYDGVFRQKN